MDRDERGEDRPESMICTEEKVAMIRGQKAENESGGSGKRVVTTEFDCRLCYASL